MKISQFAKNFYFRLLNLYNLLMLIFQLKLKLVLWKK